MVVLRPSTNSVGIITGVKGISSLNPKKPWRKNGVKLCIFMVQKHKTSIFLPGQIFKLSYFFLIKSAEQYQIYIMNQTNNCLLKAYFRIEF